MKTVKTQLTERQFVGRVRTNTRKYDRNDKTYVNVTYFAAKMKKKNRFVLATHFPKSRFGRFDGFGAWIYGRYKVGSDGNVVVEYSFRPDVSSLILGILLMTVCVPILIYAIYDVFATGFRASMIVPIILLALFSAFGVNSAFQLPRKYCRETEKLLLKICNVKE